MVPAGSRANAQQDQDIGAVDGRPQVYVQTHAKRIPTMFNLPLTCCAAEGLGIRGVRHQSEVGTHQAPHLRQILAELVELLFERRVVLLALGLLDLLLDFADLRRHADVIDDADA